MIVMNPDDIATFVTFDNLVRESLVEMFIIYPRMVFISLAFGVIRNLVVENWPENGLAIVNVVAVQVAIADIDSQCVVFGFQLLMDLVLCGSIE
jgi:hypothetical protein